jgi:Putative transposase/Transposase zinc-binding domain
VAGISVSVEGCPVAPRPALGVADVRAFGPSFLDQFGDLLTSVQRRALRDVVRCRTAALGGNAERCTGCGHERLAYNSCRNRHCPRCQASSRACWLGREVGHLLPVEYHHVVFTLPQEVAQLARHNPTTIYGLLFRASSETLREVAAATRARVPRHLGAEVGVVAVLHTWGQNLHHHPHVHCLVSGGGLACDRQGRLQQPPQWRSCRPGFFLPVRVLSRVFRGKFLALLEQAQASGQLSLVGSLAGLTEAETFASWREQLYQKEWVVYAQPPAAGPEVVLKYLAGYVHRVALSNSRLLAMDDDSVTFTWKDYAHGGRQRELTLSGEEFLRRWVQHVLPRGFVRIRHYGLLASRGREDKLAACRWQLALAGLRVSLAGLALPLAPTMFPCPDCGGTTWALVGTVPPEDAGAGPAEAWDSS